VSVANESDSPLRLQASSLTIDGRRPRFVTAGSLISGVICHVDTGGLITLGRKRPECNERTNKNPTDLRAPASVAFPAATLPRTAVDSTPRLSSRLLYYPLTVSATRASFLRCVRCCVWGTLRPQPPPAVLYFPPDIANLCNSHTLLQTWVSLYCRVSGLQTRAFFVLRK